MPNSTPTTSGRVVSIFSTKGGVGTTLITANLATTLQTMIEGKVAAVPLEATDDLGTLLGSTEVQHPTVGPTESLPLLVAAWRKQVAYVLIDAGSRLTNRALEAFERSNLIVLIMTPDVVSLRHTTQAIEQLVAFQFPLRMIKVVLNRADSYGHVSSQDIKTRFPIDVIAEIPSDGRTVGVSVNRGTPFMASTQGTRIHAAMKRLARWLIENPNAFVEHAGGDRKYLPAVEPEAPLAVPSADKTAAGAAVVDPLTALKQKIRTNLVERFEFKQLDLKTLNDPEKAKSLRERTEQLILELLAEEGAFLADRDERAQLIKEVIDDALGFGPLEDLMADEEVSDILVNAKDRIYVERRGKLELSAKKFVSNDHVLTVIERIIAPLGRRIDESTPMVDARLPDGSRVNAIIPPLSIAGPMLSIRKFRRTRYTMDDLIALGTLTTAMARFINACIKGRQNIIVSGGTGSGKTTLLNVLSSAIPNEERIITIEDAAELRLNQEHWIPLESRMPNVEGKGAVTIRQVFRNTLRMRPDRIIIGECRGDETLDMLQAMNTGHDGSLTTIHANSPEDVISRLDSLVLMGNVDLPIRAIREQIVSAIDVIIHTSRFPDGSRKVTHITELTGMDVQGDLTFHHIFRFEQQGVGPQGEVLGVFVPSDQRPAILDELKVKGFQIDESIFEHADDHGSAVRLPARLAARQAGKAE